MSHRPIILYYQSGRSDTHLCERRRYCKMSSLHSQKQKGGNPRRLCCLWRQTLNCNAMRIYDRPNVFLILTLRFIQIVRSGRHWLSTINMVRGYHNPSAISLSSCLPGWVLCVQGLLPSAFLRLRNAASRLLYWNHMSVQLLLCFRTAWLFILKSHMQELDLEIWESVFKRFRLQLSLKRKGRNYQKANREDLLKIAVEARKKSKE